MANRDPSAAGSAALARSGKTLGQRIADNWQLYLLLLFPVILTFVYKYIPMYGIQIAFRDFKASQGYAGSEWVGWYWFQRFFSAPTFGRMIKNTILISLYSLLWSFPVPIILSLMINQLRSARYKRLVQTVLYAPHFISVMVICGMTKIFLSPSGCLLHLILGTEIDFLTQSSAVRTIYVASGVWQDAGWGCPGNAAWMTCSRSIRMPTTVIPPPNKIKKGRGAAPALTMSDRRKFP